ncbi:heptaprenyl diphosphate synthase component 1 [Paenibacillus hamazuiensis]|uniref:heptaprenyl diphosphate synthase component 1 n=1 Tax=Paenibacillus hamazuiensis TaxID=2936508 RepID=UPI00200D7EC3|nr:heptaprenyl diphosphate synthase component 1 [Paenibacillus hamazuiensis]
MSSYRIPEIAKPYIEYDMIQKYTELPRFPEFRTRLLYAFLNKNASLSGNSELFALVTSLVQLGMDTHDMVSNHSNDKETIAARSRQLKVLAGDYFSSRFYHLLSQAGQIDLIGTLSNAICEANRLKMNLYLSMKQWKLTAEEYIKQSVDIKIQLFLSFSGLLEDVYSIVWPETLRRFTLLEVLIGEINRSEAAHDFVGSWGYWHVMQNGTKEEKKLLQTEEPDAFKLKNLWHKYKITAQLYHMLEQQTAQLQSTLAEFGTDKLAAELQHISEPLRNYLAAPRAIEEI